MSKRFGRLGLTWIAATCFVTVGEIGSRGANVYVTVNRRFSHGRERDAFFVPPAFSKSDKITHDSARSLRVVAF